MFIKIMIVVIIILVRVIIMICSAKAEKTVVLGETNTQLAYFHLHRRLWYPYMIVSLNGDPNLDPKTL